MPLYSFAVTVSEFFLITCFIRREALTSVGCLSCLLVWSANAEAATGALRGGVKLDRLDFGELEPSLCFLTGLSCIGLVFTCFSIPSGLGVVVVVVVVVVKNDGFDAHW